jgi:hypothetical protein
MTRPPAATSGAGSGSSAGSRDSSCSGASCVVQVSVITRASQYESSNMSATGYSVDEPF